MAIQSANIPRPLVRLNQWVILLSVILTWITGQYWLLLLPLTANLFSVVFKFNPIIRFGRLFLKKDPKAYIPEDATQQRFNSAIATFCLTLAIIGFTLNIQWIGWTFTGMVALASSIAILGFCIGCFLFFQINQYRYKRKQRRLVK